MAGGVLVERHPFIDRVGVNPFVDGLGERFDEVVQLGGERVALAWQPVMLGVGGEQPLNSPLTKSGAPDSV